MESHSNNSSLGFYCAPQCTISSSYLLLELKGKDSFIIDLGPFQIKEWLRGWEVPTEVTHLMDQKDVSPGHKVLTETASQIPLPIVSRKKKKSFTTIISPCSPFLFSCFETEFTASTKGLWTWRTISGFQRQRRSVLNKAVCFPVLQDRPLLSAEQDLIDPPSNPVILEIKRLRVQRLREVHHHWEIFSEIWLKMYPLK